MSPFITTKHKYADPSRANVPHDTARALLLVNGVAITLAIGIVCAYVILLNVLVSRGYVVKNLQQRFTILLENQDKLDRELVELRSPEALTLQVPALGLVEMGQITYPKPVQAVAKLDSVVVP